MVCKENVVSWFRNLSSHKRIDVMCTLLNMCLPFEVRYLGTYVEDRGKRDYNDLRDTEHHANTITDLNELATIGIGDTRTRRKLILYMSLLNGCNYTCAVIIYKSLANFDVQDINNIISGTSFNSDEQPLDELLLLYTMALNHPAFTYEQKSTIGNIYMKLQEEETRLNRSKTGCGPCIVPNERLLEDTGELPTNCAIPPSPLQQYPDMQMRNPIMSGVPPGLTMPPPGICVPPGTEQITIAGTNPQYLPLGFPSGVSPMSPWPNQTVMMTQMNQIMYPNELSNYPTSPLLSRQSSPSQSRSPSRSNSPMSRRNNNTQRWSFDERKDLQNQSTSSTLTNQMISSTSTQSILPTNTGTSGSHLLPNRNLQNQRIPPTRELSTTNFSRQNSIESVNSVTTITSTDKSNKQPPPPRLRTSASGECGGKEMPNFKGNLQNYSRDEIRRLSDEDLQNIGLTPNAVGQLRNIVRSQTTNGLTTQLVTEKKPETPTTSHHQPPPSESPSEDMAQACELPDNSLKLAPMPQLPDYYQPLLHHHHHHHHHANHNLTTQSLRRCYPAGIQQIDPNQLPIYTQPPPAIYQTQNPCYACLTVPVSGQRYPRCSAQHVYCLAQLQTLRLDDNNRNCSQSSSSDSTGSRSPPETPPAAPWISTTLLSTTSTITSTTSTASTTSTSASCTTTSAPADVYGQQPVEHNQMTHSIGQQNLGINERPRNRKGHAMRQKNQMINGGQHVNMAGCFQLTGPSVHSQMTFLPHGHVSLRPNTGIYPNFSAFRPNYPGNYQPNGEIMFPYPPPSTAGTPPPPSISTSSVTVVLPTPTQGNFMTPGTPGPPFTATVQQAKISCYNCGSCNHLAGDCKDQTMEDLTKRASYRLDYSTVKQPGECPNDK